MRKHFIFLFAILFLAGCAAKPISTPQPSQTSPASEEIKAFHALATFLTLLNEKNYAAAAPLYGGEYDALLVFNPEINPSDHVALWEWACENELLKCLELRSAVSVRQEGDAYIFQVKFNNPDSSLFVLGPCCGANETEMPPVSQFKFTVTRNSEHKFVVMNTPPYVP